MASWINNELIVTGEKELIEKFMKEAISDYPKRTLFSLESFIPFSNYEIVAAIIRSAKSKQELKELEDRIILWRMANWGCKSDLACVGSKVSYISKKATKDTCISVTYLFDTLYKTCIPGLKKISAKNPKLSFSLTYYGFDDCIYGEAMIESGFITNQSETTITYDEYDEFRKGMIEDSYKSQELSPEKKESTIEVEEVEKIEMLSKSEVDDILDFLN